MKSPWKFIILIQFLCITSITSRSNNYFGFVKVDSERSSTKLYSVSPMEERFKSIVGNFVNKKSEQITKNEILRTVQLKNAETELRKLDEATKETFNKMERALDDFEKLKSDEEILKVKEKSKDMQLEILDHENKYLEKILNEALNNTSETIIKSEYNSTKKAEFLNAKLLIYSELSNNLSLIGDKGYQIDQITKMKLDLGDEFISNIFEYHRLVDTFTLIDDFKKVFNDSLSKWEKVQENLKNISQDLFDDLPVFSTLNFKEIEPKRGELVHDINNPNFNDEKLANTLMDKIIKNIKEELMSNVKWVTTYEKTILLPENAVEGGIDDENNKFYVIRKEQKHNYYYGKYVRSETRMNAYITNETEDIGIETFEILTSPRHVWCSYDKSKHKYYMTLPVCRAEYYGSLIPGTLEKNGNCRFGFGGEVERITNGQFEVLQIYEC